MSVGGSVSRRRGEVRVSEAVKEHTPQEEAGTVRNSTGERGERRGP